ncbi:hypothetical protein [Bosea sp. 2RAB26]|uniref:hypothetical protein n=1 Tax=Bosea sp. 2RAB26 TaxID=3237476 RepID=UPI003F909827
MNVGRGLFRAWIVATLLWIIGVAALAYTLIPDSLRGERYQYVYQMRPDLKPSEENDFTRPVYDLMRSPSKESLPVKFGGLEYQYWDEWDKSVAAGTLMVPKVPDGAKLYLNSSLTNEDKNYIIKAFWDQRWERWLPHIWPWIIGTGVPPIILFILGWALLWIGRGFRPG